MPLLQRSHNHVVPYCEIRLRDEVIVLRGSPSESAGALLKGCLTFCVREPMATKSITLTLTGSKRLHWQERVSTVTGMTMRTIKHEEIVYEKKWQFLEFDHKNAVTLKADNYEYDFQVVIPGELPESIEGLDDAHVVYRLKAVIDRPRFAQNIVTKKHLRIVRTLNSGALELTQTMSVENLWPNKVEYSISIPSKAVVFGTSVPVEISLIPLLKGLTIGKVTCSLKELHTFTIPGKDHCKSQMVDITTQTLEDGQMEEEEGEDTGRWKLKDRLELPRSLGKCVQDCEVGLIKVRHKLKFNIQLHNPDGHMSELRAALPVLLFISPNFLMAEDNVIHAETSGDVLLQQNRAPPRYDDHYLDRLYDDLPENRFETPLPSGANTPRILSRSSSSENMSGLASMIASSATNSGPSAPLGIPDADSGRWSNSRTHGSSPGLYSPPYHTISSPDDGLTNALAVSPPGADYFPRNSETPAQYLSGPSTRANSPEGPHDDEEPILDIAALSKVPSYTTAVRTGTRNMTGEAPRYQGNGYRSLPPTPRHSPPLEPLLDRSRLAGTGRSHTSGSLNSHRRRGSIDLGASPGQNMVESERRIRLMQFRG